MIFITDDLGRDYGKLIQKVLDSGDVVSPRGMPTLEVRGLILQLDDPSRCLTFRPGINRGLMWMEIAQLIAGTFDKDLFDAVSPLASKLLTAGGAYGPRTSEQLRLVVQELVDDPDSRRAVVYIGRPDDLARVREGGTTDQPCTMTWQFFRRGGALEMIVNMRAWDLVWGLANDIPCFVAVQTAVAQALGLEVGRYMHLAGSAHVYKRHWELVPEIKSIEDRGLASTSPSFVGAPEPLEAWDATVKDAQEAIASIRRVRLGMLGFSEQQFPPQWRAAAGLWNKRLNPQASGD